MKKLVWIRETKIRLSMRLKLEVVKELDWLMRCQLCAIDNCP